MPKKRDYKKEYREYHSKPEQVNNREKRNKARYDVVHHLHNAVHGDVKGKDVDHIVPLSRGGSNSPSNWRIRSVKANRGDKSFIRKRK